MAGSRMETMPDHQIAATVRSVWRTAVSDCMAQCWPSLSIRTTTSTGGVENRPLFDRAWGHPPRPTLRIRRTQAC